MPLTLAGVRLMGAPFECYLSEYVRTVVYRVPGFLVREGNLRPVVVHDTSTFRAAIATDPVSYLRDDDFSDQYDLDSSFPTALRDKCDEDSSESQKRVFIVIQLKEDMASYPATDGQCIRIEHDGIEELAIVDCGDPTPHIQMREQAP